MFQFHCCGTEEYKDWSNVTFSSGSDVPDSCCLSDIVGCGLGVLALSPDQVYIQRFVDQAKLYHKQAGMKIHTEGCLDIFSVKIKNNIGTVGGLGIGIGFLQVSQEYDYWLRQSVCLFFEKI